MGFFGCWMHDSSDPDGECKCKCCSHKNINCWSSSTEAQSEVTVKLQKQSPEESSVIYFWVPETKWSPSNLMLLNVSICPLRWCLLFALRDFWTSIKWAEETALLYKNRRCEYSSVLDCYALSSLVFPQEPIFSHPLSYWEMMRLLTLLICTARSHLNTRESVLCPYGECRWWDCACKVSLGSVSLGFLCHCMLSTSNTPVYFPKVRNVFSLHIPKCVDPHLSLSVVNQCLRETKQMPSYIVCTKHRERSYISVSVLLCINSNHILSSWLKSHLKWGTDNLKAGCIKCICWCPGPSTGTQLDPPCQKTVLQVLTGNSGYSAFPLSELLSSSTCTFSNLCPLSSPELTFRVIESSDWSLTSGHAIWPLSPSYFSVCNFFHTLFLNQHHFAVVVL